MSDCGDFDCGGFDSYPYTSLDLCTSLALASGPTVHAPNNRRKDGSRPPRRCNVIKQAWKDYKTGRMMRKTKNQEVGPSEEKSTQTGFDVLGDGDENEALRPIRPHGGWKARGGEYLWRIDNTIHEDVHWRGTWVLEVKDIFEVTWGRRKIYNGKRWKWATIPESHWPFPIMETLSQKADDNITDCAKIQEL